FGDYQKRDAAGPGVLNCCFLTGNGGLPTANNPPIPFGVQGSATPIQPNLALNIESRTSTVGFVAGDDLTSSGLYSGIIAGVTTGYQWYEMKFNASVTAVPTGGVTSDATSRLPGTGVSQLSATVSGPTVGAYATYFSAGFSTDVTVKFDFLTVNETFNDLLATTITQNPFVSFPGAGSVNLLNRIVFGNLHYRFDLSPNFWMETTVGVAYTNSSYASGAARLGLADGNLVRVQGGARFGTSILLSNGVLMTPILTGLA